MDCKTRGIISLSSVGIRISMCRFPKDKFGIVSDMKLQVKKNRVEIVAAQFKKVRRENWRVVYDRG